MNNRKDRMGFLSGLVFWIISICARQTLMYQRRMKVMIDHNTILSLEHYKKGRPFTGSLKGMRYRIIKQAAADEDDTDKFRVDTWPEPLCFEATEPE